MVCAQYVLCYFHLIHTTITFLTTCQDKNYPASRSDMAGAAIVPSHMTFNEFIISFTFKNQRQSSNRVKLLNILF